jgi:hypothetical protein
MFHYRCYFMQGEHIQDVATVEAADDAEAFVEAERLLSSSAYPIIEIWLEKRLVGRFAHTPDVNALAAAIETIQRQALPSSH